METGEAALGRMLDAKAEVSAHYMVWEDGRVTQLVDEGERAWHAGASCWAGETDLNSCSIGIEIVNGGHDFPNEDGTLPTYPDAQIEALITLARDIIARQDISPARILAHSDIAPERKIDPGEHFPWETLAQEGIGLWPTSIEPVDGTEILLPGDTGAPIREMQEALSKIGYEIEATGLFNETTRLVLTAFQRRYLPTKITGCGDARTRAMIGALANTNV